MILPIRIKTNPTNRTSDPDTKMLCLSKLQISMNMPPILMLYPDNLQKPGHITDARLAALKGIVSSESVSLRSPVSFRALHRGHSVKSAGRFSKFFANDVERLVWPLLARSATMPNVAGSVISKFHHRPLFGLLYRAAQLALSLSGGELA